MNARALRRAERLGRLFDVLRPGARERRDDRPAHAQRNLVHGLGSAGDAMGNPASMMSTPSVSSAWAMASFAGTSIEKPGACSPSRNVVSKTVTRAGVLMALL